MGGWGWGVWLLVGEGRCLVGGLRGGGLVVGVGVGGGLVGGGGGWRCWLLFRIAMLRGQVYMALGRWVAHG